MHTTLGRFPTHHEQHWLLSPAARPMRFISVGLVSAIVQISVLTILTAYHMSALPANIAAFIVSSQVNFVLNVRFTWADRPTRTFSALFMRWGRFVLVLGSTAILNQGIFLMLIQRMPLIAASLLASSLIASLNYVLGHFVIFQHHHGVQQAYP